MLAWFNDMGLGIMGALDPLIFLSALLGVSVGAVIGIIPGLGPAVVISLAIPLTFGMGPPSSTATHWRNRGRRERPSPPRCTPRYSGTPSGS